MKDIRTGTFRSGTILAAIALAIPALVAASAPAGAAEKLRLTIISGNNFHYAPVGMAIKVLIPKVDEILARTGNYKVSWIQGFGGTVVKVRGELETGPLQGADTKPLAKPRSLVVARPGLPPPPLELAQSVVHDSISGARAGTRRLRSTAP